MSIKQQLDSDIKQAMLAGDKTLTTTLRTIKSVILNAEVAQGLRETGLGDDACIDLLSKEAKKRQESADMYTQGGSNDKARAELTEKQIIENYLPAQISDEELGVVIQAVIGEQSASGMQAMGAVMAEVKKRTAGQADGARIAKEVKARLS